MPDFTLRTIPKTLLYVRMEFRRNVNIGIVPCEADGQHTDNGEELVVEADLLPEYVAPAGEMALPKQITEHCHGFDFRFIPDIPWRERAAKERRNAEELERIWREVLLNDGLREARLSHYYTAPVVENHAFDAVGASLHLEILRHGVADVMVTLGIQNVRTSNAFRARVRIRVDQNGIDHAKDCRGCAYPQSQGQHSDRRGHTTLHQQTQRVSDVLKDRHRCPPGTEIGSYN